MTMAQEHKDLAFIVYIPPPPFPHRHICFGLLGILVSLVQANRDESGEVDEVKAAQVSNTTNLIQYC